jgi:multidrug efflux system outer membrane protein
VTAWEIDFFGRVASLKEQALAQYLATEEGRNAAGQPDGGRGQRAG